MTMHVEITAPGPQGPRGLTGLASVVPVDDIAALENLATLDLETGSIAWMASVLDEWRLERGSTLTVDHITVASVYNDASSRWVRKELPHRVWQAVGEWHIDYDDGDDENDGSESAPLKTPLELLRRTGTRVLNDFVRIKVHSDIPEGIPLTLASIGSQTHGYIVSGIPTILASGQFSQWVVGDTQASRPDKLVDAAGRNWTMYVGKFIRFTSGPHAGHAWAQILEDAGGGGAYVQEPMEDETEAFNDQARYTPTGTETYDIVDFPWVHSIVMAQGKSSQEGPPTPSSVGVIFEQLKLPDTAAVGFWSGAGFLFARQCVWPNFGVLGSRIYTSNVSFPGDFWVPVTLSTSQHQCPVIKTGVVIIDGAVTFDDIPYFDTCGFFNSTNGHAQWHFHGGLHLHNCFAIGPGLLEFSIQGDLFVEGVICGTGNTGDVVVLHGGSHFFHFGFTMPIVSTGRPFVIGGRDELPAFDYDGTPPQWTELRDCTYANLVAAVVSGGFGGNMQDPSSGCGVFAE